MVIVHNNLPDVETNNSLPVYYYSSSDLSLTRVVPDEVLLDDLPIFVILVGTGFFDWTETVCYFGSQDSHQVNFVNDTVLRCRVSDGFVFRRKQKNTGVIPWLDANTRGSYRELERFQPVDYWLCEHKKK